ncbi:MAG: DNA repair protein RecN [Nitrospirota bacterium]
MLKELRISNFTIIDDLTIEFEPGLTILTGETGAGKSIIVDAIGLLLGSKASQDMIKTGRKEALVEAFFDTTTHPVLEDLSIASEEGIILRRSISSQGKGRAYVNDSPVSMQTLSAIGSSLVDIHGQHEHQSLLRKEAHLSFLDSYGGLEAPSLSLQSLYREIADMRSRIAEMRTRVRERGQRIDFLRFQVNEIDTAQLRAGEKAVLEEERAILLNLNKLKESSETAYMLLYESEGSSIEHLSTVLAKVRDMAHIDQGAQELLTILESALPLLEDSAILLRKFKDKYDIDPQRLTELDERLELIKRLERKYGEDIDAILSYRNAAEEELRSLEHIDEQLETSEHELNIKEEQLRAMAEELSGKRRIAAGKLEKLVMNELKELGFQKAEFRVDMKKRDAVTSTGSDDVEFLLSANPGEPPKPLIKVASGGELSRIMLALKCIEISNESGVMSDESKKRNKKSPRVTPHPSPITLIFDEVDAGIGGVTARHVGKRLKDIAERYQVLCITHLPQIAALADYHLKIEKALTGNKATVSVTPITGMERRNEIARMLSGRITEGSLKHAGELLGIDK